MLIDGTDYKIASSTEEIKKAYELVYENYIEKEFCKLNIHKMRIFLFDSLSSTRTFIAKEGDNVLATVTLVFDSSIGLPAEGIFKDRLDQLRNKGENICEISKLSTQRDLGVKSLKILNILFRSCWLYAKHINPHSLFCIMVEPQNENFYLKSFFFEKNTELRIDPKANEASSILLEMPLDLKEKASLNLNNKRNLKRYRFHFEDPTINKIMEFQKMTEENILKINLSLKEPRSNATLALTGQEKKFLEFKFFIIQYNLNQISKMALSHSSKGWHREATESYENLMKTLPTWAFRKEKDEIYEKLGDMFFLLGEYKKTFEMGGKMKNSSVQRTSIIGRNLQGLAQYFLTGKKPALEILDKSEKLAHDSEDNIVLYKCLHIKAMIHNHLGEYEVALEYIKASITACEKVMPFNESTWLYTTAYGINEHLGKIKSCKEIINLFLKNISIPETDLDLKNRINFYTCMARYYSISLQHIKSLPAYETILYQLIKRDESPLNYSVHLSNYAKSLLAIGDLKKSYQVIQEALDFKDHIPLNSQISYLITKYEIALFMDYKEDEQLIQKIITEKLKGLNETTKENKQIYAGYQLSFLQIQISSLQLKGNSKESTNLLKNFVETSSITRPQLSGNMDQTTALLLLNKTAKAKKMIHKNLTSLETEIIQSDINNQPLISIYENLVKQSYDCLIENIKSIFENDIDQNQLISKVLILMNIFLILQQQNLKKEISNYTTVKEELRHLFSQLIVHKDIPAIKKFLHTIQ